MQKILFGLIFSLSLFPSLAQGDEIYIPQPGGLDSSCFELSTKFLLPISTDLENPTMQVEVYSNEPLFFSEGEKLLPYKIFKYGRSKAIDYSVLSVSGISPNNKGLSKEKLLNDGNQDTGITFDPYAQGPKEILIDVGEILEAGHFDFQIYAPVRGKTRYFVSKNNQGFIEVKSPEGFDFRYLKVSFEPYSNRETTAQNFSVQEIRFLKKEKDVILVNYLNLPNLKTSNINAYSNYECENNRAFQKKLNQYWKDGRKEKFSLSKKTPTVALNWKKNTLYNRDFDLDGIENEKDNCVFKKNADQKDQDTDGVGDVCDFDNSHKNPHEIDSDFDGVGNQLDNCPYIYNPNQKDQNADGRGDLCADDDGDGIIGKKDNCPLVANRDQKDVNINGVGDACEFDKDEDGVSDNLDNCRSLKNPDQADQDQDGIGDLCDNCKLYNPRQIDKNRNKMGDVCEERAKYEFENDKDHDKILDHKDNCPDISNFDQKDIDKDGVGDVCDNCKSLQNSNQADKDKNNIGDMCEDGDGDGFEGYLDNCVYQANPAQADQDNDGTGDLCEDDDRDGFVAAEDNCPFDYNKDQWDTDKDGMGDKCDEKDNRFFESNKGVIIGFICILTLLFGFLIFRLIKKIKL